MFLNRMYLEGVSAHACRYENISTGLLVTFLHQPGFCEEKQNANNRQKGNKYSGCALKIGCGATNQMKCVDDKATCCRHCLNYYYYF